MNINHERVQQQSDQNLNNETMSENIKVKKKHKNEQLINGMVTLPKLCKLYCFPEKDKELPSPSSSGGGTPLSLAKFWRIWEGFSWSLHRLIPDLQKVELNELCTLHLNMISAY